MADHQSNRRLMIREMVLENFKSYAGAQHVGPFHKCFSSVVGPNGSGKSNVIDAMLFVFGRRAKQLRFNKVSELIHNSTNHRNLERACVTVYFQEIIDKEGEDYDMIPGSDFTVARTANRNNTSDYYINKKKVSVKEVTTLLKDKGIDLDNNRFLILQGEVEQISLMKPKAEDKNDTGLLEYLEDIIGTDRFIAQIEEEAKRLEEMNEKRQSMIQKLKAVEKDKEGLEGKKLEAEAYIGKQAERLRHQIMGNKGLMHKAQKSLAGIEVKTNEFNARLEHERAKFKAYDAELKAVEKAYAAADKEHQQIVKSLEEVQAQFKEFEHKDTKVRMDQKHVKTKLKKVITKTSGDNETLQKLEEDIARIQKEIPADTSSVEAMTNQLTAAEEKLEGLLDGIKDEVEKYHKQLTKVRTELAPWEKQIQEVQSRMDVATSERDILLRQQTEAKQRLEAAKQQLDAAQQAATEKDAEIKRITVAMDQHRKEADVARQQLADSSALEADLEGSLRELRARCGALRAESTSQQNAGAVVRALLEAKKSGQIPGVYGRLGDLGAIDAKYDIAVSTACPSLEYIVVESTSDAQRCVELLRRNNLGVATFLILEKQRHLAAQMADKVQTPEGVPRLFDLIRCKDDKLRLAFWYAMRNTVVANSLDQATRIAYGRDSRFARVVTLSGELIAETGTLSGGGSKPRGGRMKLGSAASSTAGDAKAAAAELAKAEKELAAGEAALRAARDDRDAADKQLRAADNKLSELEVALPKAKQVAQAKRQEAADLQSRLAELESGTKMSREDSSRARELEQQVSNDLAELAKLRASTSGLQKQVVAVQAKIDAAGGEPLRRQRQLLAKLQKEIADTEADITKKEVQAKANTKQLEKLKSSLQKTAQEQQKLESEIEATNVALKQLEQDALVVMEQQEQLEAQVTEKQAAAQEAKEKKEEKQKHVGVIKSVEIEVEAALEKLKAAKKDESAKIKALAKNVEQDTTKLHDYTEEADVEVTDDQLEGLNVDDSFYQVTILEEQLRAMTPDLEAIAAYKAKEADFAAKQAELSAATGERDVVRASYEGLRKARLDGFMDGFNIISLKLKEMYQMITLGGDSELELVDTLDPFSEGIVFSVRPPKKSWKHIANLSGGEKTLSSLSLVFALHHYKPTPLYVMDEIDAALDFKNVSIVGHYIKERTKNAQFVIISLRNNMFELADRLVGIYKTDNATKTVTINPGEFVVGSQPKNKGAVQHADEQQQENQEQPTPMIAVS